MVRGVRQKEVPHARHDRLGVRRLRLDMSGPLQRELPGPEATHDMTPERHSHTPRTDRSACSIVPHGTN